MINLVDSHAPISPQLIKLKATVVKVTTVVLGLWVVAMGVFVGWTAFSNRKTQGINSEVVKLEAQAANLSEVEAVVRKVYSRSVAVEGFINDRVLLGPKVSLIAELSPNATSWRYDSEVKQTFIGQINNPEALDLLIAELGKSYSSIQLNSAELKAGFGWSGNLNLSKFKSNVKGL